MQKKENCVKSCLSLLQPSFLTSHQKQDPAAAVSIPVSDSTHFRAISDTGTPSLTLFNTQSGESTAHGGDKDTEESKNGDGLTAKTEDRAGREQGINLEQNFAVSAKTYLRSKRWESSKDNTLWATAELVCRL